MPNQGMFDPSLPWWEFALRAVVIYAALLVFVRMSGKRTVGQFTPFDLLVVMLLSESVSNGLNGGDESITGGLIAAATLILLNVLVAFATSRSKAADELFEGAPVLLAKDGKAFPAVLRRHRVSESDLHKALREADCTPDQLESAILEADGHISVAKRS